MTVPPVIIVGSGVAGLCAALAAAPRRVLLLSRCRDAGDTASHLAQGGIAAALGPGDSTAAHARDTLAAGAGHNDTTMVRQLVSSAPQAIVWLRAQGVAFDRLGESLALGREGGHGVPRIVHAAGDSTGASVTAALSARVRSAPHIEWRGDVDADALLLRGSHAYGVRVRNPGGGSEWIEGDSVVLATGGLGALFSRTTNPAGSSGAGLALAMAAGARVRDLEFVQFHPTALATGGSRLPLITEALRGAGARLLDHRGRPLMAGLHSMGDLAPRDLVARQVWQAQRDGPVWLDATGLPAHWCDAFPGALATCLAHGVDPRSAPIPVTPAAHFHMGGIATDAIGRSSLPGLYAVGEVACNGVHGANRLASNSLLEGVVFGRRLGRHLSSLRASRRTPAARDSHLVERGPCMAAGSLARLRDLMWHAAGPLRCGSTLADAERQLRVMATDGWQSRVAHAVVAAALRNTGRLGAHWRSDLAADVPLRTAM